MIDDFEDLVGKRIVSIFVSTSARYLKFITSGGTFVYRTTDEGDVGNDSRCYFEELLGVQALLFETVTETTELNLGGAWDNSDMVRSQRFGFDIATRGGAAKVIFRHDDNGYYCGGMELTTEPVPADVMWHAVTTDWSWSGGDE